MFNDKHLSWNWEWARKMYDTSRELGFPFMAGSSLPVTWRTPSVEMPLGSRISEAMCVCYGGVDSYDFHGLETVQCMVERRQGGETGVQWIQAYRGEKFWEALREGVWPKALMDAALCRSHTLMPARAGLQRCLPQRGRHAAAGAGSGGLPLSAHRRAEVHHAADERTDPRFQLRRLRERPERTVVHPDVPADARWPHHAGGLLQPAGESHGEDVPDRQGDLSDGADAAHHRADRGRRGESVPRADALRDAAPGDRATSLRKNPPSGEPNHADATHFSSDDCRHGGRRGARRASRSASRSSRPSTGTSRTRSTWATASWSAIRTPAPGTSPT